MAAAIFRRGILRGRIHLPQYNCQQHSSSSAASSLPLTIMAVATLLALDSDGDSSTVDYVNDCSNRHGHRHSGGESLRFGSVNATSKNVHCLSWSSIIPSPLRSTSNNPFEYPALQKAVKRRTNVEKELKSYIEQVQPRVQHLVSLARARKITADEFKTAMAEMKLEVGRNTQKILYGVEGSGMERREYEIKYGCCRWTRSAIDVIVKLSPIIEIGAGRGHWQKAITDAGGDCIAFDNHTSASPFMELSLVGHVSYGDEQVILKHPNRTLLLVCPPPYDMARRCLACYTGEVLLYVGEGRGGVHADKEWFDLLERDWRVEHFEELEPFPECYERLYVLRRKKNKDHHHHDHQQQQHEEKEKNSDMAKNVPASLPPEEKQ